MEILNTKIDTTSSDEASSARILREKAKPKNHTWIFKQTFETAEEAEKNVSDEQIWGVYRKRRTEGGNIAQYRCLKVKRRGEQCNASVRLLYHAENLKVSSTMEEHDHDQIESKAKQIAIAHGLPSDQFEESISNEEQDKLYPQAKNIEN